MNSKILIVGFGNIGFRHFQSMNTLSGVDIYVYDSRSSLYFDHAYKELKNDNNLYKIHSLAELKHQEFDLLIHATTADVRCSSILELIELHRIFFEYILLEKIPFSKAIQWEHISKLVAIDFDKTYINYARNAYSSYAEIKNLLLQRISKSSYISTEILGGAWNLISNSLHYIHLVDYLHGVTDLNYSISELKFYETKRKNYFDAFGNIKVNYSQGEILLISTEKINNTTPAIDVKIDGEDFISIKEDTGIYTIFNNVATDNNFVLEKQSSLTSKIWKSMIQNNCLLPNFSKSSFIDFPLIKLINANNESFT